MWHFQRSDPAPLLSRSKFVAFVGSGGKTSFTEYVARYALGQGKRVAITTTTKIFAREPFVLLRDGVFEGGRPVGFTRIGRSVERGKLTGISFEDLISLGKDYDLILIEADGAKGKPLKYPASFEPVIPPFADRVCVVAGLSALNGIVADQIFRWELFHDVSGIEGGAVITRAVFLRLLARDALLKGVEREKCIILLNQYDMCLHRGEALVLAREAAKAEGGIRVYVSSIVQPVFMSLLYL